ncbi:MULTISPECIES: ribonuclease J [unclassified Halanaerobium]|uniref:ribonuclease J n=1 Tax=unclassified Halanaerobium TaxID=2641197 RepID=UPI000DF4A696|nr:MULTISPECIES: ribonuclease J [unclassified Halanaerobium]RCW51532.1 ribonuclease J [Halanaerobium sp. MA284_MarDTE_T2]RCW89320.1 ribonuclease J [Halanaerobium sp. DL-01]
MSKKNKISEVTMTPLGGVGEIGKNMMVLEIGDEMLIVDSGVKFPENDLLGIDLVIPDFSYVLDNKDRVNGIVLTHGHEDHIGGLPYLLKDLDVPVYGTKLTLGFLEGKLKEHQLLKDRRLKVVHPGKKINVGSFTVEFVRVNHSIADTCALALHTPLGPIIYASDFKFDQTPIDGEVADYHKLAELGDSEQGVLALFSDSTNVEREGYTLSERVVGKTVDEIFRGARERIIVATFASNIHRVQQVVDAAFKYDRKIAFTGRSMINNVDIARRLGYLQIPDDMIVDIRECSNLPDSRVTLLTTGSQGEPMAALTRMARGDHYHINIKDGDTVMISASAIPGNEKFVGETINKLFKRGANVIYENVSGVHVSGHASQEELKLMLNLVKPKFFVPTHGEFRHLYKHADLAEKNGIPKENIYIAEIGDKIKFTDSSVSKECSVQSGDVLIDGLGIGDVGNIVLRDRRLLSEDGIIIVVVTIDKKGNILAGPDIITRGFVYIRESEELIEAATQRVEDSLKECEEKNITEWSVLKNTIRNSLNNYIYKKIKRNPMILPIIMEV